MRKPSFIIISGSENVKDGYKDLDIKRIDLYRKLTQLRMIYFEGGFRSHLDILNKIVYGKYFSEASYDERKNMYSIWNMPLLNGVLAVQELQKRGIECKIINNFDSEYDIFCEILSKQEIKIIGISTTFILQWSEISRISKKILKDYPDAILILGGSFVNDLYRTRGSSIFEKPMKKLGIKFILYGNDADIEVTKLYDNIVHSRMDFEGIKNMIFLDDLGNINMTEEALSQQSIDIDVCVFNETIKCFNSEIMQFRVSIGCPFRCAFCSYPAMARGYQRGNKENIREYLQALDNAGIKKIVFIDDTLNVQKDYFSFLLAELKKYKFRWYSFLRVQFINSDIATEMKDSGCDGVYLGLESGDDNILKLMNKKSDIRQYRDGIEALRRVEITTFAAFIVGFPGETEKSIENTISFIDQSGLDYYSLKEFFYIHESPIHGQKEKYKLNGEGFNWEHITMTSEEATKSKLYIYDRIKKCLHINPDLGLWYLIYLRGKSFSWQQIFSYQKIIDILTREDNSNIFVHSKETIEKLNQFRKFK